MRRAQATRVTSHLPMAGMLRGGAAAVNPAVRSRASAEGAPLAVLTGSGLHPGGRRPRVARPRQSGEEAWRSRR